MGKKEREVRGRGGLRVETLGGADPPVRAQEPCCNHGTSTAPPRLHNNCPLQVALRQWQHKQRFCLRPTPSFSACLPVHTPSCSLTYLLAYLFNHPPPCLSLSACQPPNKPGCLSVDLAACLPTHPPACLLVCLSACLLVCLSAWLLRCLAPWLPKHTPSSLPGCPRTPPPACLSAWQASGRRTCLMRVKATPSSSVGPSQPQFQLSERRRAWREDRARAIARPTANKKGENKAQTIPSTAMTHHLISSHIILSHLLSCHEILRFSTHLASSSTLSGRHAIQQHSPKEHREEHIRRRRAGNKSSGEREQGTNRVEKESREEGTHQKGKASFRLKIACLRPTERFCTASLYLRWQQCASSEVL